MDLCLVLFPPPTEGIDAKAGLSTPLHALSVLTSLHSDSHPPCQLHCCQGGTTRYYFTVCAMWSYTELKFNFFEYMSCFERSCIVGKDALDNRTGLYWPSGCMDMCAPSFWYSWFSVQTEVLLYFLGEFLWLIGLPKEEHDRLIRDNKKIFCFPPTDTGTCPPTEIVTLHSKTGGIIRQLKIGLAIKV